MNLGHTCVIQVQESEHNVKCSRRSVHVLARKGGEEKLNYNSEDTRDEPAQ
jgi:hypothetical protein